MIDDANMTDQEKRFWSKVDIQRLPDGTLDFDKCWNWLGCKTRPTSHHQSHPGYGQFRLDHRRVKAHRHAWELFHGERMASDKDAAHTECDNPPCCNPTHVKPEAHSENWRSFIRRYGSGPGKAAAQKAKVA